MRARIFRIGCICAGRIMETVTTCTVTDTSLWPRTISALSHGLGTNIPKSWSPSCWALFPTWRQIGCGTSSRTLLSVTVSSAPSEPRISGATGICTAALRRTRRRIGGQSSLPQPTQTLCGRRMRSGRSLPSTSLAFSVPAGSRKCLLRPWTRVMRPSTSSSSSSASSGPRCTGCLPGGTEETARASVQRSGWSTTTSTTQWAAST
mmetsp:Transcript_34115/g.68260  ORF Transcript_34115/g.68260 Transcript_34115/m.68260 type:complete len:206 (-) Transcript_34115:11-628(-)